MFTIINKRYKDSKICNFMGMGYKCKNIVSDSHIYNWNGLKWSWTINQPENSSLITQANDYKMLKIRQVWIKDFAFGSFYWNHSMQECC